MNPLSIIGLFCEDIRLEKGDVLTLVGLMPDNVNAKRLPSQEKAKGPTATVDDKVLSKICIYARANFDPDDPVKEIKLSIAFDGEQRLQMGGAAPDVVERAKQQAKERGNPLAGVIMRAMLQGFRPPGAGVLRLEADIGSEKRLIAALNFKMAEEATSSSEPAPPSLQ